MKKVMLAMSGGVDSSVALVLLKDKYEVIGATLKLFDDQEVVENSRTCCSLEDIFDAKLVASKFGIPHYVFNFKERFHQDVISRFNASYLMGETPNPCIDCNRFIKFSSMLERAEALDCDYLATGHYARIEWDEKRGRYLLKKALSHGEENAKDQSYVLYNLTQHQLSKVLFPLGDMGKGEARAAAQKHKLVNADKPDSQDICFVPDGNYSAFISRYTGETVAEGEFVDSQGKVLGNHKGITGYTVGQRKGLGLSFNKPMYVTEKRADTNEIVLGGEEELLSSQLICGEINLISIEKLENPMRVKAKTRYKQQEQPCIITPLDDDKILVVFDEPQRAITPGQSVVFYDGDIVVGGGIIKSK